MSRKLGKPSIGGDADRTQFTNYTQTCSGEDSTHKSLIMQALRQSSMLRVSVSCSRAKRHHYSTSTSSFRLSFTSHIPTARARSLKFSSHGHHRPHGSSSRGYATYRDVNMSGSGNGGTSTIPESSLLSQTLDQRHNDARGRDSVGPFGLGVAPQTYYSTPEKKWSELSMKGKSEYNCPGFYTVFYVKI